MGKGHRARAGARWAFGPRAGARAALLLGVLAAGVGPASAHDKTDAVSLVNGDRYQGEIKKLAQGSLSLDTDAAGTISLKWSHVTRLVSRFRYQVRSTQGAIYYGVLAAPDRPGELKVVGRSGTHVLALDDVFLLLPIEHGFWAKLDGSINLGFSYTQSNQALQYSLSANTQYRTRKWLGEVKLSSIFNRQKNAESANQQNLGFTLVRGLKGRMNTFALAQFQSNPAQGFDLRSVAGGGAGVFLWESRGGFLVASAGLVVDREDVAGSARVDTNAEALAGVRFSTYRFNSPKRSVSLTVNTFTNLTDTPRFRLQMSFTLSWEIVSNLNVSLNVLDSYDSRPPTEDASKNDLSVTSSLGYSF